MFLVNVENRGRVYSICRSVVSVGLALSVIALPGATSASAESENHARYLAIHNCGGYDIKKVKVERKVNGEWKNSNAVWDKTDGGLDHAKLGIDQILCFDLSGQADADQYRLKVFIDEGDTKRCDGTIHSSDGSFETRLHRMKGTTHNNNGCRSVGYSSRPALNCSFGGARTRNMSC